MKKFRIFPPQIPRVTTIFVLHTFSTQVVPFISAYTTADFYFYPEENVASFLISKALCRHQRYTCVPSRQLFINTVYIRSVRWAFLVLTSNLPSILHFTCGMFLHHKSNIPQNINPQMTLANTSSASKTGESTTPSFEADQFPLESELQRKAVRKLDYVILPIMTMFYLLSFLVRLIGLLLQLSLLISSC